ncbi:hypothetical protein EAE96_004302 [Botrytis aclada]|nr:hypothetical protein EAE96_004302 [Botrytis aclada]
MMSAHICTLIDELCRNCSMLPDFRQAPGYIPEDEMTQDVVTDYQNWNRVAQELGFPAYFQNLPLPELPNQYAHFHSTNIVAFDLLCKDALETLYTIVHHGLVPASQARIIQGEDIPLAERTATLNMHQILLLNLALAEASQALNDYDWRIAMGHRVFIDFAINRHFTRLEDLQVPLDDCSICVEPLNHHDEGEMHTAIVKTVCGHIFHERCLEGWFVSSAQGDCPFCRTLLRVTELPQVPTRQEVEEPIPEWLTILFDGVRQVVDRQDELEDERADRPGVPNEAGALVIVRRMIHQG